MYNWKVDPKLESEFLRVWHVRTMKIEQSLGSYGSRLYRADNGTYVAIALWPSEQQWAKPESPLPDDAEDAAIFAQAVEHLSTQKLTMLDDLWHPRPGSTEVTPRIDSDSTA